MSIHTVLQITKFTTTTPTTTSNNNNNNNNKNTSIATTTKPTTTTTNKMNNNNNNNNTNISNKKQQQQQQQPQQQSSQNNNNNRSQVINHNQFVNDNETFSFQDFISEIINENDLKWHRLIIQDLERTIELKFREFKKQFNELEKIRIPADIFTKISKEIFKSSLDEPLGILGARINIRLQLDGGKIIDLGRFQYDPTTLTTFEVFVILKEEVTSVKKLLQAFKLHSNFGKFLSTYIDGTNYEFSKRKLY